MAVLLAAFLLLSACGARDLVLHTNGNELSDVAPAADGVVWAVGSGGAVRWAVDEEQYTKFTVSDGMGDNVARAVTVVPGSGLLAGVWVGTAAGVSHQAEDGWVSYGEEDGLKGGAVRVLAALGQDVAVAGREGGLWAGGYGVCHFDGREWVWYGEDHGLASNGVTALALVPDTESLGGLWVGALQEGVTHFNGVEWTVYDEMSGLPATRVRALTYIEGQDDLAGMWAGTSDGVCHFDGSTWNCWDRAEGLPTDITGDVVRCEPAAVCVATWRGVARFDGKVWSWERPVEARHQRIEALVADRATVGTMWAATLGGLVRYSTDGAAGATWTAFQVSDPLPSNDVEALAIDGESRLWVGTHRGGLVRFDGETWVSFPNEGPSPEDDVVALAVDEATGVVWVGTVFDGLDVVNYGSDGETVEDVAFDDKHVHAVAVAPDDAAYGGLWLALGGWSGEGIARLHEGRWTTYGESTYRASDDVEAIAVGAADGPFAGVWVATRERVAHFDGYEWATISAEHGLPDNDVRAVAIVERPGPTQGVWFAYVGGVVRYDPRQAEDAVWTSFLAREGPENGPVGYGVSTMTAAPDGSLWVGTGSGLSRYDGRRWRSYDRASGLAHNEVQAIAVGVDGTTWVGTAGGGLSQIRP